MKWMRWTAWGGLGVIGWAQVFAGGIVITPPREDTVCSRMRPYIENPHEATVHARLMEYVGAIDRDYGIDLRVKISPSLNNRVDIHLAWSVSAPNGRIFACVSQRAEKEAMSPDDPEWGAAAAAALAGIETAIRVYFVKLDV